MPPKSRKYLSKLEKLTRKDARQFDKEMALYMEQITDFQNFVDRVDDWYNKNEKRYLKFMALYGEDVISETEFKLAFRNLRAPFTALEEHIICRMIDPEKSGRIEYAKLYEGIWKALANKYVQDDDPNALDLERRASGYADYVRGADHSRPHWFHATRVNPHESASVSNKSYCRLH